jgi:transposase-like protein
VPDVETRLLSGAGMEMHAPAAGTRARRNWKSYSEEVKARAISLVLDEGKTLAEGSRELGLSRPLIRTWVGHALATRRRHLTLAERDIIEQAIGSLRNVRA